MTRPLCTSPAASKNLIGSGPATLQRGVRECRELDGWTARNRRARLFFTSSDQARGGPQPMTQRDDENDRRLAGLLAVGFSRREAMKMLAALGMTAAGAASFADSGLADTAQLTGPGGIALARPDQPVTLPLHGKAIESGLKPETGGTFRLFNYADYLDKKAMDDFGKKYGVTVELTS